MIFPTIVTFVVIFYLLVYLGMIGYDLFIKKDIVDLVLKHEDEDVDISDEAGKFKPIKVDKADRRTKKKMQPQDGQVQEGSEPVATPPVSTDNNPVFDDEQPSNRKSLNEDVTGNADPKDIVQPPDGKEKEKPLPKINMDDEQEPKKPISKLDFEDESLPYVSISEDDIEQAAKLTGAINVDDLLKKVKELSEKGVDSEFGQLMADWKVYEMEQNTDGDEELRLLMSDNSNCLEGPLPQLDL